MPRIDFNSVDEVQDFRPLPPGKYVCRLADVEETSTKHGDEMWKLKFEVAEGEYAGRYVFDNMVFSESLMKRVKLICARLGIDVSGEMDLTPTMLIGKTALLSVEEEDYEDSEGRIKRRNKVLFAGYEKVPEGGDATEADDDEEDLPF